jgi:hypothetical protein
VIDKYREWAQNKKDADLIDPANRFVKGSFPLDFFKAAERYVPFSAILDKANSEDNIINMDMVMVPDWLHGYYCLMHTVSIQQSLRRLYQQGFKSAYMI